MCINITLVASEQKKSINQCRGWNEYPDYTTIDSDNKGEKCSLIGRNVFKNT